MSTYPCLRDVVSIPVLARRAAYIFSVIPRVQSKKERLVLQGEYAQRVAHRTASKSVDAISVAGRSKLPGSAKDRPDGANCH